MLNHWVKLMFKTGQRGGGSIPEVTILTLDQTSSTARTTLKRHKSAARASGWFCVTSISGTALILGHPTPGKQTLLAPHPQCKILQK